MRASIVSIWIAMLSILLLASSVLATVPRLMNYQGKLTDENGVPVPDNRYDMRFRIYTDSVNNTYLWEEFHLNINNQAVEVKDGLFNVVLGLISIIPDTVFTGETRWLGIKVEADPELTPRKRIASVAYGFKSLRSDTADYAFTAGYALEIADNVVTSAKIQDGQVMNADIAGNAVASAKIQDGTIVDADVSATADIVPTKISGTAWTSENDGSGSGLDADMVDALDSSDLVQTSGDQTINGVKTFGSIPVLPGSDPIQDNEASRKAYVNVQDATKISIPDGSAQGDVLYHDGSSWVRLPAGTDGQYLETNGAAADPTWSTPTFSAGIQVFASSGIWSRPPGVTEVWVRCWGAGGGGGGNRSPGDEGGGGGGAGAYAEGFVTVSGDVSVAIGSGGSGGSSDNNGDGGGSSSFGTDVVAGGGAGGAYTHAGGAGGSATAGDLQLSGAAGQIGLTSSQGDGGTGGSSPMGGDGGYGGILSGENGTLGTVPGGGGGGGGGFNGDGGAGANGLVIVHW